GDQVDIKDAQNKPVSSTDVTDKGEFTANLSTALQSGQCVTLVQFESGSHPNYKSFTSASCYHVSSRLDVANATTPDVPKQGADARRAENRGGPRGGAVGEGGVRIGAARSGTVAGVLRGRCPAGSRPGQLQFAASLSRLRRGPQLALGRIEGAGQGGAIQTPD